MPNLVHFEISADDVERARRFYSELFGWDIRPATPGLDYWLISTDGAGSVGGGLMKRQGKAGITNYIGVSSVEEYVKRVESLGGKVVIPKMAVAGMGYFAVCLDTEANPFGIWQDDKNAR